MKNEFYIESKFDGLPLSVLEIVPDGKPCAVVYMLHGLCGCKERFIPFMEFTNQPSIMIDDVKFFIDENKDQRLLLLEDSFEYRITGDETNENYKNWCKYIKQCKAYKGQRDVEPALEKDIVTSKFEKLLEDKLKAIIPAEKTLPSLEGCYAYKNKKHKVKKVTLFVESNGYNVE